MGIVIGQVGQKYSITFLLNEASALPRLKFSLQLNTFLVY